MPPPVPDRYRLELRLGRDGDIEEWLATDTSLERPVLIRALGPESTAERRRQFVDRFAEAAKTSHTHLSRVFAVEEVPGGAYAVCEWTGGVSLADRVSSGHTIDLEEFLPNASGLSGALAALHATGGGHGNIDLSSISYAVAHPAKLGGFGRVPVSDQSGDVAALAAALEETLTGAPPGGPPPSETIDGVPRTIDRILRSAQQGWVSADELEKALLASPTLRPIQPEPHSTSRRLLYAAAAMVVLAVGLVALGRLFSGDGPIIPVSPTATLPAEPSTSAVPQVTSTAPRGPVRLIDAAAFDPFGEGGENDDLIPNLTDGDVSTVWRSERYQDPVPLLKPGVGLSFRVEGSPGRLLLEGFTPGTRFELYWAPRTEPSLDDWERVAAATAPPGAAALALPSRPGGSWLIWLTDLPLQDDGTFHAEVAEVRFTP